MAMWHGWDSTSMITPFFQQKRFYAYKYAIHPCPRPGQLHLNTPRHTAQWPK